MRFSGETFATPEGRAGIVRGAGWAVALALAESTWLAGCGGGAGPITDPATDWPASIGELGDIDGNAWRPDRPDGGEAVAYDVGHPLWSGGTEKARWLLLPAGEVIDDRHHAEWQFPDGAVAFKTFQTGRRRLETRAVRQLQRGRWDYAAYLWDADGRDAELLSLEEPVAIDLGGGDVHTVPAASQCRECHEAAATAFLGIGKLQLAGARVAGGTELERFDSLGLLARGAPEDPTGVSHGNDDVAAVLGWMVGNCVHCHNGGERDNSSFDLSPDVALANTVEQPTTSSASAAGIRIVPGAPEDSILFLAVSGEGDEPEIKPMPPVGIDRRDKAGIAALRAMIEGLAP